MDARLQQRLSPPPVEGKSLVIQEGGKKAAGEGESGGAAKIDFKQLLVNSNREVKQNRQREASGDLSHAKSYEDFLTALNKKSRNDELPKNTLGKDDFLKLFITQLQYQDPLKPKDGTEMASEMAQFNSLEQMMNVNSALERLEKKTDRGHNIEFVNYIGKEVAIKDGRIRLEHGKLSQASFRTEQPVSSSTLLVKDSMGQQVAAVELGPLQAGEHPLQWDGKNSQGKALPSGIYKLSVQVKDKAKGDIEIPVSTRLQIAGVDLQDQNSNFYTDIGKIGYSDIAAIGSQGYSLAAKEQDKASKPLALPLQAQAQALAKPQETPPLDPHGQALGQSQELTSPAEGSQNDKIIDDEPPEAPHPLDQSL